MSNAKLALLPSECHDFFYSEPATADKIIRDFFGREIEKEEYKEEISNDKIADVKVQDPTVLPLECDAAEDAGGVKKTQPILDGHCVVAQWRNCAEAPPSFEMQEIAQANFTGQGAQQRPDLSECVMRKIPRGNAWRESRSERGYLT